MYDDNNTPQNGPEDTNGRPTPPQQPVTPAQPVASAQTPSGAGGEHLNRTEGGTNPSPTPSNSTTPSSESGAYRAGREQQQQEPWRTSGGYQSQPRPQRPSQSPQPNTAYQSGAASGTFSTSTGKTKKSGGWGKVAAVAIVASLIFGTAGGYLGATLANSNDNIPASAQSSSSFRDTSSSSNDSGTVTNTSTVTGETLTGTQIYELATEQVVSITATGVTSSVYGQSESTSMGTGFVLTEDGYICTNYHVISIADSSGGSISVNFKNGDTYQAELVGGYSEGDVALLKIEATGLSAVTLGDSNNITVGESVYVVGNALGTYDYTQTSGIVSGLDRDVDITDSSNQTVTMNMFQLDAAVNSGNSGGPVYNAKGEVIGIVTSKLSSSYSTSGSASIEGLGFAIPINDAVSIADEIKNNGFVAGSPIIGISGKTVSSDVIEYGIPSGAYVESVTAGGAAETAGIQAKDIITKIDETELTSISDLKKALKKYDVGDTVTLTVYRNGETLDLELTFTETENSSTSSQDDTQQEPSTTDGYPYSSGGYGGYGGYGGFG